MSRSRRGARDPKADTYLINNLIGSVIGIVIMLLALAFLVGDPLRLVGTAIVALAIVPLRLSRRAQVSKLGREHVPDYLKELGWLVVGAAVVAGGFVTYGLL